MKALIPWGVFGLGTSGAEFPSVLFSPKLKRHLWYNRFGPSEADRRKAASLEKQR
jgi:hypothetical protein